MALTSEFGYAWLQDAIYSSDLLTSDSAEFMLQLGENDQGKSKYCCKESKGRKRELSRVPVLARQQHHNEQSRIRRAVKSS